MQPMMRPNTRRPSSGVAECNSFSHLMWAAPMSSGEWRQIEIVSWPSQWEVLSLEHCATLGSVLQSNCGACLHHWHRTAVSSTEVAVNLNLASG